LASSSSAEPPGNDRADRRMKDHLFVQAQRDLAHLGLEPVTDWLGGVFELTLMQKGVSKNAALARFAKDLGVSPAEVMAFGDGALDAGMLEFAGHGVAMANGALETLAAADEITLSNEQDGVAAVLERLLTR